jgi:glycerol-3-phosphate cytidylyltransferase-like family protein
MLVLIVSLVAQSAAADLARGQPIINNSERRLEICRSAAKSGKPVAEYVGRIAQLTQQSDTDRDALINECRYFQQGRIDAMFDALEDGLKNMKPDVCIRPSPGSSQK